MHLVQQLSQQYQCQMYVNNNHRNTRILFDALSVTSDRSMISQGTPVFSTNKADHYDITEILLKVALNIITLTLLDAICKP